MATLFLALQCVQCSTMQVKQQKKSSNKWVCAVCNQRQSLLRVHARGYRAADLRRFVQGANLSRGRGSSVPETDWGPAAAGEQRDEVPRERRPMDWSEYLDDPGECDGGGGVAGTRDGGIAIEVTTELPQESPKVTTLKRLPKAQLGIAGKRPKPPINPTSSKRQRIEQGSSACSATATAEAQKSKWSKYLDASFFEERSALEGFGQHRPEFDECVTTEVVVDDEVHPDFI